MQEVPALKTKQSDHLTGEIYRVSPERLADLEDMFREVIENQIAAFEPYRSVEDVLNEINTGSWQAFVFVEEKSKAIFGLAFTSLQRVANDVLVMTVQFGTFHHFFAMAKLYDYLELLARDLGCSYIESITLPTVAEYAVRKKGFTAPLVYIRKPVANSRRN